MACREARPIDAGGLGAMCSALLKRGPDEQAYYFNPGIGLALRRLSIIGLEAGQQPVHNEDGTVVVIMNGEIYNYRELRSDLERRGHVFATDTDTETIAHLYEERGEDCVKALRGMFAFAVWDERQKRLFLARDRIGIKPLYYGEFGDWLVFASELKAILALPWVKREIDWSSLDHLFSTMTTPGSGSIVAGIRKLEPGHTLSWSRKGALCKKRYWRFRFEPDLRRSEADTIEMLRERLEETVRAHLVSDVPVGAFLSGGIDSSAVVAMMTRVSNVPVKTFSIGFREPSHDESSYAKTVAAYLGTEHHELILDPDMTATIEDFAWHMDEPFGDVSALATFAVSRLASQQLKVVLSGDGGDELFAGYDHYLVEQRERRGELIPQRLRGLLGGFATRMPEGTRGRNFLRHLALTGIERWRDAGTLFREEARQELFRPEVIEQLRGTRGVEHCLERGPWETEADWLSRLQHDDLEGYLPLDVLTKVDRMSMANSLEARVPLLDHQFVEFAASIPAHMRLRGTQTKYIFKKSLVGVLPHDILYRKKQGFGVPIGAWMRSNLEPMVSELLLSRTSRCARFLNQDYIARLMAFHQRGRGMDLQLWTLVSFELWCRRFLDSQRPVPIEQPAAVAGRLMASGL